MKTTKILAFILALVLALSMVSCNLNSGNGTTPETTPTPTPTKTADELINIVKEYFANTVDICLSGTNEITSTVDGASETAVTEIFMHLSGVNTENPKMKVSAGNGQDSSTAIVYVDGVMYINMAGEGMAMKVQQAMSKEDAFAEYGDISTVFPYDTTAFGSTSVEYKDGNFVMTVTGLTREAFISSVLLLDPEMYENNDAYEADLAEYEFDSETGFTMIVTVNAEGKLVSIVTVEIYSYMGEQIKIDDVVNIVYDAGEIVAPADADEYVDLSEMYG